MRNDLIVLLSCFATIALLCVYFAILVYPKQELSEETKKRSRSWVSNAFFREFWYFLMGPLKLKFIQWGVDPNTITWWGFAFSFGAAVAFSYGEFGWAALMTICSSTCDVYDGQLARARNISLKSGSFLDSCLDRIGEAAMFFGLMYYFRHDDFWFVVLFLSFSGSQLTSYARARAEGLGFGGARGFFQRAERMIVLSIGMGCSTALAQFDPEWGMWLVKITMGAIALGSVQTAISRSISIYREIKGTESPRITGEPLKN